MITSDRKARLMLSCAIDGGDPAVADLVQNLGAEGAWAKIIEGVLGEPVARRAAQVTADVFERLAEAAAARFVVPGDDEWPAGLDDLRHAESIQRRGGEQGPRGWPASCIRRRIQQKVPRFCLSVRHRGPEPRPEWPAADHHH